MVFGMNRKFLLAGVLAVALGLIALFVVRTRRGPVVRVTTSAVTEGAITRTVMTSGTLAPAKTVDVGAQVSGTVEYLGADFNTQVRAGEVIARLDPAPFDADLMQATAALTQSQADAARLQVLADDARVKLSRTETLASADLVPQTDLENARLAYKQAATDLRAGNAATQSAGARLDQSRANRTHTVIRSPIDGVVVNRLVETGQTLNAAMNAPVLFTIADLRHMLLLGEIHEAEMGAVRPGAPVTFEIESRSGQQYAGTVAQVRLQPLIEQATASPTTGTTPGTVGTSGTSPAAGAANAPAGAAPSATTQTASTAAPSQTSPSSSTPTTPGVVTYTAVVDVENPDGAFSPGGTGLMTFVSAQRERAVRIPNNALIFRPDPDLLHELGQQELPLERQDPKDPRPGRLARVWLFRDGQFDAETVRVGLADDAWTELLEGAVRPGDRLVTQAASR
jgi:RND family efflux transporter MFP subunit